MKTTIVLSLTASLILAGCTEYSTQYRVGNTKTETNVDQAACNRFAADTVPIYLVTDWIPRYGKDGRIIGHRVETYDINEGRRHTAVRECMAELGYQRVSIPFCKSKDVEGKSFAPITGSPPLTPTMCGLRQEGGQRVLVDLSQPL